MNLEEAIEVACLAHRGQTDKRGQPYILHPIRVMQHSGPNIDSMIVAVLHDTLEDTSLTEAELRRRGLRADLVESVVALTRRKGETYGDFIRRVALNHRARRIKIKDLEDNMSKSRNPPELMTPKDHRRLLKYRRAHAYLYSTYLDENSGLPLGTTATNAEI